MSAERIVVLGPPASGKGTQVERLRERFGYEIASTGQMLRDEEALGTEVGLLSIELSKTGTLLPDRIVLELVESWLGARRSSVLFDGFPRTVPQAKAFDELIKKMAVSLDSVIEIKVPEDVCRERVSRRLTCQECGRAVAPLATREFCAVCGGNLGRRRDDSALAFDLRMEQFHKKTIPVVNYYRERGMLKTVDGQGTPDEVFDLIVELVK